MTKLYSETEIEYIEVKIASLLNFLKLFPFNLDLLLRLSPLLNINTK